MMIWSEVSFGLARAGQWNFQRPLAMAWLVALTACSSRSGDNASRTRHASTDPQRSTPTEPGEAVPGRTEDPAASSEQGLDGTAIRIVIGEEVLTARLWDNATAQDLVAQLPLTLTFSDFNQLEKIARLLRELSMDGVPEGDDPSPGDIGYYAPSGDIVLYYGDVGYFAGIVRIGQFDGDVAVITRQPGDFAATIEIDN